METSRNEGPEPWNNVINDLFISPDTSTEENYSELSASVLPQSTPKLDAELWDDEWGRRTKTHETEGDQLDWVARSITETVNKNDELLQNHRRQIELFQEQWEQREQEFLEREKELETKLISERSLAHQAHHKIESLEQLLETNQIQVTACLPSRRWTPGRSRSSSYVALSSSTDMTSLGQRGSIRDNPLISGCVKVMHSSSKWKSCYASLLREGDLVKLRINEAREGARKAKIYSIQRHPASVSVCTYPNQAYCLRIFAKGSLCVRSPWIAMALMSPEELHRWLTRLNRILTEGKDHIDTSMTLTNASSSTGSARFEI